MQYFRLYRSLILLAAIWLIVMYYLFRSEGLSGHTYPIPVTHPGSGHYATSSRKDTADLKSNKNGVIRWRKLPERFPVAKLRSLPSPEPGSSKIPKIQANPPTESDSARMTRLQRLAAVKESFLHSWNGYKTHAWMRDEVTPLTGEGRDSFGGWAATLVDALDTLWIMGLTDEFDIAVKAADTIDFSSNPQEHVNIFETTIRYLGGFLAAYELSGRQYEALFKKAVAVAELLMCAFDTESRMPIARWNWKNYMAGHKQNEKGRIIVSEIGSLSLEFTKLSQLTGDMRYYDAVQRISDAFEEGQDSTMLPGMWPVGVHMSSSGPSFKEDHTFTLGGMSDSLYEYLPKQYLMLGGVDQQPRKMYEKFITVAKKHLFRRALNPNDTQIIISDDVAANGKRFVYHSNIGQHLTCFVGGMVGIASKIFNRLDELEIAQQITDGCVWAYGATPTGIMPEVFNFIPCGEIEESQTGDKCSYTEEKWRAHVSRHYNLENSAAQDPLWPDMETLIQENRIVPGILRVVDSRYVLRPEAIESVFIMYRLTGDPTWMDKAWTMFQAIEKHTRTKVASASVKNVMSEPENVVQVDSMESFWMAETLKYFYLIFSDFEVIDLDKWVLNTEAHPLHRPDVA